MIEVLLVDDHPAIGEGTKMMIEADKEMAVTFTTSSNEALELLKAKTFNLLLFDLAMPGISGLELTRRVKAINSDIPILIYTGYEIDAHFNLLIEAGVSGFISKTSTREQLLTAIYCALRGEAVIPISLLKQLRRTDVRISNMEQPLEEVSINEKEQEILIEITKGKSNREIAKTLLMSQRTVEHHLTRIFGKLNVSSRAEAILEAKRQGIIPNEELVSSTT
ncbi:MAG: response regulator [Tepidibacillus sp.]